MAVGELDLVVLDGALVGLDGAFILDDGLFLVVELLLGDGVAGVGGTVAVKIDARLGEDALIVLQRTLGLGEGGLVGTRVDVDERLALADDLSFFVVDGHDLAGDLAVDGDGEDRRDGPESVVIDVDIAGVGLSDGDGGRALCSVSATSGRGTCGPAGSGASASAVCGRGLLRGGEEMDEDECDDNPCDDQNPEPEVTLPAAVDPELRGGVGVDEGETEVSAVG